MVVSHIFAQNMTYTKKSNYKVLDYWNHMLEFPNRLDKAVI